MEITTTIIIPNYNGLKFMDECIRSLNAQTYPNFRTLVVDINGSTDGSVEWLKEHQIDTIFLPENTGFSGAVNVGIKAADTPYVLLLNNDVRVDEYFVAEMVRAIGQSERIFSVSSRMIQMYHPDRLDDAGDMLFPNPAGVPAGGRSYALPPFKPGILGVRGRSDLKRR